MPLNLRDTTPEEAQKARQHQAINRAKEAFLEACRNPIKFNEMKSETKGVGDHATRIKGCFRGGT